MLTYIIRRLILIVPTLIGVTAMVFFIMALSPGGVGGPMLDEMGSVDVERGQLRQYYEERYGLDQPLIVQYTRWLNRISPVGLKEVGTGWPGGLKVGFKWPDLGESMRYRRPVLDLYKEALPITLLLNAITIPIAYVIAIVLGIYMARFRGQSFDVASGTTMLALWSLPTIWVGVMMIGFFANQHYFYWFPTGGLSDPMASQMPFLPTWGDDEWNRGWLLDRIWHLTLPVLCLMYGSFAFLSKLTRGAMLENLSADFVRTAKAKGTNNRIILFRHVFRNSLLPLITVAAGILPSMIGGAVIIEKIFSIQGIGLLTIDAIFARDRELVLAGALVSGVLGLIAILIADICYAIADPRVSYD